MRRCTSCHRTKPNSAFYRNGDKLTESCKHCKDRQNQPAMEAFRKRERAKRIDAAGHEMKIRMLGNSCVFVTCSCLDAVRVPARVRRAAKREALATGASPEWKSLGDFPVGTPSDQLVAAFNHHLETT